MTVNIYSVVMSVTLFTVISTICSLFLVHTKSKHLWVVALILGLCFVRCFVPVEVNGSFTINCWEIYPELFDFMQYTLFRDITVGRLFYIVWLTGGIICLVGCQSLKQWQGFREVSLSQTGFSQQALRLRIFLDAQRTFKTAHGKSDFAHLHGANPVIAQRIEITFLCALLLFFRLGLRSTEQALKKSHGYSCFVIRPKPMFAHKHRRKPKAAPKRYGGALRFSPVFQKLSVNHFSVFVLERRKVFGVLVHGTKAHTHA